MLSRRVKGLRGRVGGLTVRDINPAVPSIRTIPDFPQFRVLKVMQVFIINRSKCCFRDL